ncbi:MAG: hypothetical protein ACRD3W_04735, partial [Terriglobales bacterium]
DTGGGTAGDSGADGKLDSSSSIEQLILTGKIQARDQIKLLILAAGAKQFAESVLGPIAKEFNIDLSTYLGDDGDLLSAATLADPTKLTIKVSGNTQDAQSADFTVDANGKIICNHLPTADESTLTIYVAADAAHPLDGQSPQQVAALQSFVSYLQSSLSTTDASGTAATPRVSDTTGLLEPPSNPASSNPAVPPASTGDGSTNTGDGTSGGNTGGGGSSGGNYGGGSSGGDLHRRPQFCRWQSGRRR